MSKKAKKELQHRFVFSLVRLLRQARFLPLPLVYGLGALLGWIGFSGISRHRKTAFSSLSSAFPSWPQSRIKKAARHCFVFMAQSVLEVIYFLHHPDEVDKLKLQGRENIDSALAKKRGVIGVSSHLGNFALMAWKLSRAGYPVKIVARPFRDRLMGEYFEKLVADTGLGIIYSYPRQSCGRAILGSLKANEIVIILMDQNFGTGGVWVEFFGRLAATPVGPIIFALKSGAALVPIYSVRTAIGDHSVTVLPETELERAEDEDETILLSAIKLTKMIEQWIRANPLQWPWIHRRWKSRPSTKIYAQKFKVQGQRT